MSQYLSIPRELLLGDFTLDTNILFLVLGLIFWLYILWYESKRDGFDDMRIFDMGFLSMILGFAGYAFLTYIFNYLRTFYPVHFVTGLFSVAQIYTFTFVLTLLPVFHGARKLKWSMYRILDIYSLAFAGLLIFVTAGVFLTWGYTYLVYVFVFFLVYLVAAPKLRVRRFLSGGVFSAFVLVLAFIVLEAFSDDSLRFTSFAILVIISLTNLYFVIRKNMTIRNIADEILNNLKKVLLAKRKDLKVEQELLIEEDPYLREGRDTDNAEAVEEAIMEDAKKEEVDLLMEDVSEAKENVDEALQAMKAGDYGVCKKCGNPIDVARLKALPETRLCIDCAEKSE